MVECNICGDNALVTKETIFEKEYWLCPECKIELQEKIDFMIKDMQSEFVFSNRPWFA